MENQIGQQKMGGSSSKDMLHIVLLSWQWLLARALAVLLLLLVLCRVIWNPETLLKEVDQRLAQVLLRPLAV